MIHVPGYRIAGVACAVPRQVVTNEGANARAGKAVGVMERRHCVEQSLGELAYVAAAEVLKQTQVAPEGIAALIFVTQSQVQRIPSAACELHHALGLGNGTPAFDVGLACSGYTYGLWIAASLRLPRVLLVVGDTISRFLDPADTATFPIFGDAVSATIVERSSGSDGADGISFVGGTDGRGAGSLYCDRVLHMDGEAVFHFALSTVPQLVHETTMNGYVDYFLFHQANRMLVEHVAKKSRIPLGRVPFNIGRYGNTSSASIPLLICDSDATEAIRSRKCSLALFGFGGGFSWAGVLTETHGIPCSVTEV